jgi:hypothetical protein
LCGKISTLLGLQVIVVIEFVDLLSILSVSLPQVVQLIFQVLLLSKELSIQILMLVQITFQP